jgi:hypothetical protein
MNPTRTKAKSSDHSGDCPSEGDLSAYFDRELTPSEFRMIDAHVRGCKRCKSLIADIQHLSSIASDYYCPDGAEPIVAEVECERAMVQDGSVLHPNAITRRPYAIADGETMNKKDDSTDLPAETVIDPTGLSETIAGHVNVLMRLGNAVDTHFIRSAFGRMIGLFGYRWGVASEESDGYVESVIRSLSKSIRQMSGKSPVLDGVLYRVMHESLRLHLPNYVNDYPTYRSEDFVNWRQEYKHAILEWILRQVRPDIKNEEWRWVVYWRTEVVGLPDRQVAAEFGINEGKVLIAKCQVEQKVKDWLKRFLAK